MSKLGFDYKPAPMQCERDDFNERWNKAFGKDRSFGSGKTTWARRDGKLVQIPNGEQRRSFPNIYTTELERYK